MNLLHVYVLLCTVECTVYVYSESEPGLVWCRRSQHKCVCIELKLAAGLRFFEAKAVAAAAEKLLLASIKAGREAATDRQVMA